MIEQIIAQILAVSVRYGPWAGLAISLGLHYRIRRAKSRKDEEHRAEVESLKKEYEIQRSDGERRFQEFKELYHQQREEANRRFEQVVQMYEKNVDLVQDYRKLAEDQLTIMSLTIERLKEANEIARNNLFCPVQRIRETRTMEMGPTKS